MKIVHRANRIGRRTCWPEGPQKRRQPCGDSARCLADLEPCEVPPTERQLHPTRYAQHLEHPNSNIPCTTAAGLPAAVAAHATGELRPFPPE